jgi:general secretion pathway protein G
VKRPGFTLVELMVVLAVIALLLTIAVPRYLTSVDRAKEAVLRENLYQMRDALQKYYADKGRYPETIEQLVSERYLRDVPLDPVTESAQTWIAVQAPGPDAAGVHDVRSGAQGSTRDGVPFADL